MNATARIAYALRTRLTLALLAGLWADGRPYGRLNSARIVLAFRLAR